VEKLVSTDFIREHSDMVKLPGYLVNAVSVVPFGSHPCGVWNQGIPEFEAYAEDYAFMTEFNRACDDRATLATWIKDWVMDCNTFEDYLSKLGAQRLLFLKGKSDQDAWRYELEAVKDMVSDSPESNNSEAMVISAAREIKEKVLRKGYKTILAGAGTACLAAWLATYQLRNEGHTVNLVVELGYYGSLPRPAEPFQQNYGNFHTCTMLTDIVDSLGVFTTGATNKCLGVLGGAQVDKSGNINSTRISDRHLTGSGGANDVGNGASEVIVVMSQSRTRFVNEVPYITAAGTNVKMLVSQWGVFEKKGNDQELALTKLSKSDDATSESNLKNIRENCGWKLKALGDLEYVAAPTREELTLLRMFDPKRYYTKD
jgi:acyl CoA:acetate/3-ketoacid CoA transferase beta subunit